MQSHRRGAGPGCGYAGEQATAATWLATAPLDRLDTDIDHEIVLASLGSMMAMITADEFLTAGEIVAIADVSLDDLSHAIEALPVSTMRVLVARRFAPLAAPYIGFYTRTALMLEAPERRKIIATVHTRITAAHVDLDMVTPQHIVVQDGMLTVNLTSFFEQSGLALAHLRRAKEAIHEDPKTLGGRPTFKRTRIPAHDVAAAIAAGVDRGEIYRHWPRLPPDGPELATIYLRAYPLSPLSDDELRHGTVTHASHARR